MLIEIGPSVTDDDAAEAGPVPTALVATTVNVYEPSANPLIVHDVPLVVHVAPPGLAVAV